MKCYFVFFWGVCCLFLMVGCSKTDAKPTSVAPTLSITASSTPALSLEDRLQLEGYQVRLRESHQTLQTLWTNLSKGQSEACGTDYPLISPSSLSSIQPIAADLRQAAIELYEVVQLWEAECDLSRQTVPPDLIQTALRKLSLAEAALQRAETALAD